MPPTSSELTLDHDRPLTLIAAALAAFVECQAQERAEESEMPSTTTSAPATATAAPVLILRENGLVEANGIDYYYEIYGDGEPLLLLHGGLGSIQMFGPVLPAFAEHRRVIAVDLLGHGRTELGDRKIVHADIANDVALVLDQLDYDQVDALGYSFGGGVALRLAIQHPEKVRRLVVSSMPFSREGFFPEMLPQQAAVGAAMAEAMKETPMYQTYVQIAPHPEDFPRLLDRMGEMMRQPYNWAEEVKTLRMPVMLVFGDSDMITLDHVVEFYHLLGGGLRDAGWMREHMSQNRLAIIPDMTHYEMFMSPLIATTTLPFLDGQSGQASWAEQVAASK
jgi:pimeloyl-ACP methyl ester carboxylesterase